VANVVLGSVRPEHEGKASGANNAIRELGGVFGVAVLASVFAHSGGYRSGATFVHGTTTAVYVGGAVVALGAVAAGLVKTRRWREVPEAVYSVARDPSHVGDALSCITSQTTRARPVDGSL